MDNEYRKIKETLAVLDQECIAKEKAGARAKRRFESALFDLMEAERALGAALQKRTSFEGRHMDIIHANLKK